MANMVYTDPAGVPSPVDSGLASRAALCLLGVLKSGLEDLAQFRALEEWRLWRFKSLLAVSRLSIGKPSTTGRRESDSGSWPDSAGGSRTGALVLNYYKRSKGPRQAVSASDLNQTWLSHNAENLMAAIRPVVFPPLYLLLPGCQHAVAVNAWLDHRTLGEDKMSCLLSERLLTTTMPLSVM